MRLLRTLFAAIGASQKLETVSVTALVLSIGGPGWTTAAENIRVARGHTDAPCCLSSCGCAQLCAQSHVHVCVGFCFVAVLGGNSESTRPEGALEASWASCLEFFCCIALRSRAASASAGQLQAGVAIKFVAMRVGAPMETTIGALSSLCSTWRRERPAGRGTLRN